MMTRKTIIISPHLDDAAFSLGAALLDRRFMNPTIVSVFTRSRYRIDGCGDVEQVTSERQTEDIVACRALSIGCRYLGFEDASLRAPYADEAEYMRPNLNVSSDPVWDNVCIALRTLLTQHNWHRVVLPLGVGNHIDHRIVRDAALYGLRNSTKVLFFQDLTYDRDECEIAELCAQIGVKKELIFQTSAQDRKFALCEFYASQIDGGIRSSLIGAMEKHGGERVWVGTREYGHNTRHA